MLRAAITASFIFVWALAPASAQSWAEKMFSEKNHDFGTVARGADVVHRFEIENIFKEDVHIRSVRTSCGCTIPTIENDTLKSWEKGYLVAKFDTRKFRGYHSATLTVTIDRPYYAEVQVRVHGYIRGDVVFHPGSVQFENVDQGQKYERKITVNYAGRSDWKILDVRSTNDNFEVELTETSRNGGRISYDLIVRMRDTAPAGYLRDELVLVTNDHSKPRIPLDVEGRVIPEISISPQPLVMGTVEEGGSVSKKLVVRGKVPFKITSVNCPDGCFTFEADGKAKKVHLVNVIFNATKRPGKLQEQVTVTTDRGAGMTAVVTAYATIIEAPAVENDVADAPSSDTASE